MWAIFSRGPERKVVEVTNDPVLDVTPKDKLEALEVNDQMSESDKKLVQEYLDSGGQVF